MFERLFDRNGADEEQQAEERRGGAQPPGDPAAPGQPGQPGQPADPMAGDGQGALTDDGPDVGELDVRLGELEEDVDSLESSLRAVRSSQDEFADTIEEMSDRVRQLVGVYDRLSAAENPFVDDAADAGIADGGGSAGRPGDGATAGGTGSDGQQEDVVSFDDLEQDRDGEGGADHPADDGAGDEPSDDGEVNTGVDADRDRDRDWNGDQDPGGRQEPERERAPPVEPEEGAAAVPDRRPVLESVPDSYAGEVLVMEWLSVLMEGSGPADALRAVGHYEDAGWISREVRDHLLDVIGGPTLDVHVDPTQSRESTADEHAVSYRYLSVLAHLDDI